MHPVLIRIPVPGLGPVPIYAYGVMLGLSLVVGWYLTLGLAARDGLPKEKMANNYVVTAIAAVVASRVLYVLTNWGEFADNPADVFSFRSGGLVAYGGFLGGLLGSYVYLRRHGIPLLPWADVAVPSLASGLMITRIGCYLFGCDFGHPLGPNPPALLAKLGTFPHWPDGTIDGGSGSPAWVHHVKTRGLSPESASSLPVHPTQLYESLVGLVLLVVLLASRRKQAFRGQIFFIFAFAYGVARFLLELVRDDLERGDIPPALPVHVLVPGSLVLFAAAYAVGIAPAIRSGAVRLTTQIAGFLPAVMAYVAYAPEPFAGYHLLKLSTSQAIGLGSAVAAALAYGVFHRAAQRHPEAAMALNLPPEAQLEADEELSPTRDAEGSPSEEAAGDEPSPEKAAPPKAKSAPRESTSSEEPTGEPPRKAKRAKKKSKPEPSDDG